MGLCPDTSAGKAVQAYVRKRLVSMCLRRIICTMTLQNDNMYYLAMKAKDARFDGCFFTGVTSTGIYCRPVCKVRTPKRENCQFFGHAALAEAAGFRPCMRCRPELAPHSLIWSIQDASHTLAMQASHLLDTAWLSSDVPDAAPSIASLAARLGVSDRHLRRIFEAHLGVSPLQYLQTRRLLTAKQLLTDTAMSVQNVAHTSGFASVRRFNTAFAAHYRMSPTRLRSAGRPPSGQQDSDSTAQGAMVSVKLSYRPPYDVQGMLQFLQNRQINAMENIASQAIFTRVERTFSTIKGRASYSGWISAEFDDARCQVLLTVSEGLQSVLPLVIARVRAALDLDADPKAINAVLGPYFPGTEGVRVPGCLDGYEIAVRAILGQQVTVAAGRTLTQRLVDRFGEPISTPRIELSRLFPAATTLASVQPHLLGEMGIVRQRQTALVAISQAVANGQINLNTSARALDTVLQLTSLPGIGDWTAQYIAIRALRWPDAFPAGDVALQNALGVRVAQKPLQSAKAAELASKAWQPWRSYAVLRAWNLPKPMALHNI